MAKRFYYKLLYNASGDVDVHERVDINIPLRYAMTVPTWSEQISEATKAVANGADNLSLSRTTVLRFVPNVAITEVRYNDALISLHYAALAVHPDLEELSSSLFLTHAQLATASEAFKRSNAMRLVSLTRTPLSASVRVGSGQDGLATTADMVEELVFRARLAAAVRA